MKLSYYGYYLKNRTTHRRLNVDLSAFMTSFAQLDAPDFKLRFKHNSEHLYLHRLSGSVFIFAMTRDSEKFKRINTSDLSIGEIQNLLGSDEKIGFASYLTFRKSFFGFASASFSPKFDTFCNLVNAILHATGNGSWEFCVHPLAHQATKQQAVHMSYIGKTTIEVSGQNSLKKDFLAFLGAEDSDDELEALEITLKPKKGHSIKSVATKLVNSASEDGVEKLIMKAKNDAMSAMLDLYIVGRGIISDEIGVMDESKIPLAIEDKIRANVKLKERLQEFINDDQYEKPTAKDLNLCSDVSAWSHLIHDLQDDYRLTPGIFPQPV
ncbi:hypothetical protein [Pseudomonas sp. B392_1p]|uniref:hypothetical protein n=1 Tax=Pseudomonas sp. B392_1p TaxID=3457507 RepID=UPI003FCF925A